MLIKQIVILISISGKLKMCNFSTKFLNVCYEVCYCQDERPVVTTSLGKIRGYLKTSHEGRKFSAFEGVPFAKPPIGSRRFEVGVS
jgi:hypothetical protein